MIESFPQQEKIARLELDKEFFNAANNLAKAD